MLILVFWPWILALGLLAIVLVIAVTIIAISFQFAQSDPETFFTALILVAAFVGYFFWQSKREEAKRTKEAKAKATIDESADTNQADTK